ncbi:MAG: hypothetical protein H0U16_01105, partial [Actinobacteria bacterium]|nr:hypothetical protein [Actinomycetota bacterium]
SFSDYGRALIAADQASHPEDSRERDWICDELVRRAVVADLSALDVTTNFDHPSLEGVDRTTLVSSDWAAYTFADANRELLGIPPDAAFRVRPRLDVTKLYYHGDGPRRVRECIFKVSWEQREANPVSATLPSERSVTVGTTLALDWASARVRCCLTTATAETQAAGSWLEKEQAAQRDGRTAMLKRMADAGILQVDHSLKAPDGGIRPSVVEAETMEGVMRVRGAARMLHISQGVT